MISTRIATAGVSLLTLAGALTLTSCAAPAAGTTPATAAAEAGAESAPFTSATDAVIVADFDLTAGQLPENIISAHGDAVAVTFA